MSTGVQKKIPSPASGEGEGEGQIRSFHLFLYPSRERNKTVDHP
jgi:hypothetical protein